MLNCVIIDDEPHAITGLCNYIQTLPELNVLQTYTDPLVALKAIKNLGQIDLLFLDIDMPLINGIELAKEIRNYADKLIFTTAHTRYADEAFELSADDYLLKPYSLGKFVIALNKLFPTKISTTATEEKSSEQKNFFFAKSKEDDLRMVRINYDDIIAVESKQNYILIYTATKNVLTYMSLYEMLKVLAPLSHFMQLHRSYIVNQNQIETIDGNYVKMNNGIRISVGDQFRKAFNVFVTEKSIKVGRH